MRAGAFCASVIGVKLKKADPMANMISQPIHLFSLVSGVKVVKRPEPTAPKTAPTLLLRLQEAW